MEALYSRISRPLKLVKELHRERGLCMLRQGVNQMQHDEAELPLKFFTAPRPPRVCVCV